VLWLIGGIRLLADDPTPKRHIAKKEEKVDTRIHLKFRGVKYAEIYERRKFQIPNMS